MPPRISIEYITGSSSITDDQRQQWDGSSCTGTILGRYANHTITSASAGTVEIDSRLAGANSLSWTITGRGSAGTIHMRFRRTEIGDFSDAVTVFDGVVSYASGVASLVCVDWVALPAGPCSNGTRSKAGVAVQELLTRPLVETILAGVSASPLAPALASFFGTIYLIEDLCSRLPPPAPPVGLDIWFKSAAYLKQLLDAAAWPYFCECTPGAVTPTPPPVPVINVPPGLVVPPAQTCDPLDLCSALVVLLERTGQLEYVVNSMYQLITTMQRYSLPFSYVRGRSFGPTTGAGSLDIARVVGVQAVVNSRPPGLQTFSGAPEYVSDLGWISAITPDGMIDEIRLTRDVQGWFSKLLPSATTLGWSLRDGVSATFTELLAEP